MKVVPGDLVWSTRLYGDLHLYSEHMGNWRYEDAVVAVAPSDVCLVLRVTEHKILLLAKGRMGWHWLDNFKRAG